MKISKQITQQKDAEFAFDIIIESIAEYKNININTFNENKIILVSFDNTRGADYYFDYNMYCSGPIGKLVVVKEISEKILGESLDPRKVIGIINQKILNKQQQPNKPKLGFFNNIK